MEGRKRGGSGGAPLLFVKEGVRSQSGGGRRLINVTLFLYKTKTSKKGRDKLKYTFPPPNSSLPQRHAPLKEGGEEGQRLRLGRG